MSIALICQNTLPSPLKYSVNCSFVSKALFENVCDERTTLIDESSVTILRHWPGWKTPLSMSSWSIHPLSKYIAGDVGNQLWRAHAYCTIRTTLSKSTSISFPNIQNLIANIPKTFSTTMRACNGSWIYILITSNFFSRRTSLSWETKGTHHHLQYCRH